MLNPEPRTLNSRSAFTLIELAAVLAIMGMLVAVAAVSFKATCRAARAQYAVEQLQAFDKRVREHACLHGRPATLTIDLDKNLLSAIAKDRKDKPAIVALGSAARIDRVCVGRRTIDYGRATISIFQRGTTPTYAVRLRGSDESTRWLLFAGLSGQITEFLEDDNAKITNLLNELSSTRFDAH